MTRPRLLDLFCGAGGAAMGYHRAGFEVVGVDIVDQPHYPFEFHRADALEWTDWDFDAIHASPPCQAYTSLNAMWNRKEHKNLIPPTRVLLRQIGVPWVIENVPRAPLREPIMLCGSSFGLVTESGAQLRRHRLFEASFEWPLLIPGCAHDRRVIGVYGGHGRDRRRQVKTQDYPANDRRVAMGIDWMTGRELSQAIPPAYTEWIGARLLAHVGAAA